MIRRLMAAILALFLGSIVMTTAIADEGAPKTGPKDGDAATSAEGERDPKPARKTSKSFRKSQRIYKAYDKNKDDKVVFEEWLKMKEGAMDDARKAREKKWFDRADADKDGSITIQEFHKWLNRKPRREGPRKGPADAPTKKSPEAGAAKAEK